MPCLMLNFALLYRSSHHLLYSHWIPAPHRAQFENLLVAPGDIAYCPLRCPTELTAAAADAWSGHGVGTYVAALIVAGIYLVDNRLLLAVIIGHGVTSTISPTVYFLSDGSKIPSVDPKTLPPRRFSANLSAPPLDW